MVLKSISVDSESNVSIEIDDQTFELSALPDGKLNERELAFLRMKAEPNRIILSKGEKEKQDERDRNPN